MAVDPIFGSLIGAGSSLLGGLLGQNSADENRNTQMQMAQQNINLQREFAKNAIQWKVEDARNAGIHPLFALGAQTTSFSPVSVGNTSDNSLGEGLAKAGQDISRAFSAHADNELRALQLEALRQDVIGKGLSNDVTRAELGSRLAKLSQPASPPAFPVTTPGQVKVKPDEQTQSVRVLGKTLLNDPFTSDAGGAISDVFGDDAGEFVMAIPKATSFVFYNALRNVLYRYDRATGEKFDRYIKHNFGRR